MSESLDAILKDFVPPSDEGRRERRARKRRGLLGPVCEWDEAHPVTGRRWQDMFGSDPVQKKLTFALYRRGLIASQSEIKCRQRHGLW